MRKYVLFIVLYLLFIGAACGRNPINSSNIGQLGTLKIKVVDSITNTGVAGVKVSLKKEGQLVAKEQLTDTNGEVIFKDIPCIDGYKAFVLPSNTYKPTSSNTIKLTGNLEITIPLIKLGGTGAGLLAGSVKDASNQQPLNGVNILLSGSTNSSAITDSSGQFTIEGLAAGNYNITFSKSGYKRVTKFINVQEANITTIETVFMKKENIYGSNGGILVAAGNGTVYEFDMNKNLISRKILGTNITGVKKLYNGNILISDVIAGIVSEIDINGKILWSTNSVFKPFKTPNWISANLLGATLVTDTENNKVTELVMGRIVWTLPIRLNKPAFADYTPNGNIIVSDTGNSRIIEVDRNGNIVWTFNRDINKPIQAKILENGNILITDSGYCRVIEITKRGVPVWYYDGKQNFATTNTNISGLLYPRSAIRLSNGNTLIADTGNNRILEVSPSKDVIHEIPNIPRPNCIEQF